MEDLSSLCLFAEPPAVNFRPQPHQCQACKSATTLKVLKTSSRLLFTLHIGPFIGHETVLHCPNCGRQYHSAQLSSLVPDSCNYGYDVMVYVGQRLFLANKKPQEICMELKARNVSISGSEVGFLGKKFIVYLALAHQQSAGRISQAMMYNGGYVLHLDGTCEGSSPVLMTGLDSLTEIILGNVKLPSENANQIIPFLKEIKTLFGKPIATVHDMGRGIQKAVDTVFGHKHDFICHYHFLRDIGKDLLWADYDSIRKRLRKHGLTSKLRYRAKKFRHVIDKAPDHIEIFRQSLQEANITDQSVDLIPTITAYTLIQWALDGKNQGHGYGFPFDRPHVVFTQRLYTIYDELQKIKDVYLRRKWRDNRPLFKLAGELETVVGDKTLRRTISQIEEKIDVFDQLRDAMRIAPKAGTQGLNSDNTDVPIDTIEGKVKLFRETLIARSDYGDRKDYHKMVAQIDQYWLKLFADPISVETPNGTVSIQPQRTNNIMERSFRDFKRGWRSRTGNGSMAKAFQTMLADTPLVRNLKNPDYVKILLNGKKRLESVFAEINEQLIRTQMKQQTQNPDRIPPALKKLISNLKLPEMVENLFLKA